MSELLIDPIEVHKALRTKQVEVASNALDIKGAPTSAIDISWLPEAAKTYNLSPNIDDYVINTVLQFPLNMPNRNGMGFSLSNIREFSWDYGCPWYKTWVGQPLFYEHKNDDCLKSNGIILDNILHKDPRGFWKVLMLAAHDRTKYPDLIKRVANKELTTYSMGAYILGGYVCSITGRDYKNSPYLSGNGKDKGRRPQVVIIDGVPRLAFRVGLNPKGFETSLVEEPAWTIADSDGSTPIYM